MLARLKQGVFGLPLMASHLHTFNGPTLPTAVSAHGALATATAGQTEVATFANGCFWGTQHMFDKFYGKKGIKTKVGYTGGSTSSPSPPSYRQVCSGSTGHAEAVRIEFDPSVVSYAELVELFYRTHDASHLNHQGPDRGSQYRSAIFFADEGQRKKAEEVTKEVEEGHYRPKGKKVVTEITKAGKWYDAEDYHQDYLADNPGGYECPTHVLHW